jgi:hypothetical protein
MMNMTSEILDDYNTKLEEQDICYKNNRGKYHFWESLNSQQISRNIIEQEYYCEICGCVKYNYSYIEDDNNPL